MPDQRIVSTGYEPWPLQTEIHRSMARKRFSVLVCHRRFGKTVLAVNALIDAALRFNHKERGFQLPGKFSYVAPYYRQAKDVAWAYLKEYSRPIPGIKILENELSITYPNHNSIKLYGADNADNLRGLYHDGMVIDEVADIKPNVWGEIIRPALEDRKGWAVFIGTPKGVNLFSERYYKAIDDDAWFAGMYPATKTNIFTSDPLEQMRSQVTESQYAQEMLCDFAAAVDNALIPLDLVLGASGKHMRTDEVDGSPKVLGVDVARYGDDRSVIFPRQGLIAFKPRIFRGINNMDLAASVAHSIDKFEPDAVMIDAGRGEGVIDRLRQLNYRVHEVNFGGRAGDPHYHNKRAEMWDTMRRWLEAGGCIPDMAELQTDLCAPTFSYANAANKFELESKDKLKERINVSPDLGDALALTFAMPVAKKSTTSVGLPQQRTRREYNPMSQRL